MGAFLSELGWLYAAMLVCLVGLVVGVCVTRKTDLPEGSSVALLGAAVLFGLLIWALTFPHVRP